MAMRSIISHPVEISLRLIGAWPNASFRNLKYIIWTTIMLTFLILQYWYCITHVKVDNLMDLLDGLSLTLSNTLLLMKFIIIWLHNRTFLETLVLMAEDWDSCKSEWNMEVMIQKATISHRIARLMLIGFTFSVCLYIMTVFFAPENNVEMADLDAKKFLLRMEFPFDATVSPLYEIIVSIQIIVQSIFSLMAGMSMALIVTFVLHLASQIDVVCDRLVEIFNHCNKETRVSILRTVILKHQRLIHLFDNIESVFTLISLLQFFCNILVICFVSFILVSSISTDHAATIISKCLPYYVAVNFEALILCYTSEYLTSKSENISWVAYHSSWYELSIHENRALLLLTLRSQRPLALTAGKVINLSLEAFANMLKASASYVSVLYAME